MNKLVLLLFYSVDCFHNAVYNKLDLVGTSFIQTLQVLPVAGVDITEFSTGTGTDSIDDVGLDRMHPPINYNSRVELNQEFSYLLHRDVSKAEKLLRHMNTNNITGTDTINILLSHCFRGNKSIRQPREIFNKYFGIEGDGPLRPSVVTLNIMIEGCREANDMTALTTYFNLFKLLELRPDRYTYSTLG